MSDWLSSSKLYLGTFPGKVTGKVPSMRLKFQCINLLFILHVLLHVYVYFVSQEPFTHRKLAPAIAMGAVCYFVNLHKVHR